MSTGAGFEAWLCPTPAGLHCRPGGFFIDPAAAVERAVVTHGHADHARSGHARVLATPQTVRVMQVRHAGSAVRTCYEALAYGVPQKIGDVRVTLLPAGHILGSAQVLLEYRGRRAVVSGDYKRHADPTCAGFELARCDLFVTEATFGLPVFRHEPDAREISRLLASLAAFPERAHLVGVYGLGKCQRLIALLRCQGYDDTIYLHGALRALCALYEELGVALGLLAAVADEAGGPKAGLAGQIVLCPPAALTDRWSRRLSDPLTVFASGWMRVRGRARQRGVELPLVISDHADWPELLATIAETGAEEIWVTHGREEALVHEIGQMGRRGRALALIGREEEGE